MSQGTSRGGGTSAARGAVYLTISKAWFSLVGAALLFLLMRKLRPEEYGIYVLVTGLVSVLNSILLLGAIQGVSKRVSEREEYAEAVKRKGLQIQLLLGGGVAIGYLLLSPAIARVLRQPEIAPYFRLSSLIILFYSLYAVFIGTLNGRRLFLQQALFDISYSSLRFVCTAALVLLGLAAWGAIGGFVLAAGSIFLAALLILGFEEKGGECTARSILSFNLWVMVFTGLMALIPYIDLFLLKTWSLSAEIQRMAGYYGSAQQISRLPYIAVVSITFVVFPLISKATFKEDHATTRRYISETLRYVLLIVAPLAALVSSCAPEIYRLIAPAYHPAAVPLSLLVIAFILFCLFSVSCTIISGSGSPQVSAGIALIILCVEAPALFLLIRLLRLDMTGAALSLSAALLAGVLTSGIFIYRRFGAYLSFPSALRVLLVSALLAFLGRLFPTPGARAWILLPKLALLLLLYAAALLLVRELRKADIDRVRRVLWLRS